MTCTVFTHTVKENLRVTQAGGLQSEGGRALSWNTQLHACSDPADMCPPTREIRRSLGPRGQGQWWPEWLKLRALGAHVDKRLDFHRVASETFSFHTVLKINLAEGRVSQRRSDRYILFYIR